MDEQRVQAYLSLIEKLFGCPSGEELQILNGHLELVDEGLLQVCEWVAAQLQEERQDNQVQFVRNVAQKVTAFLRNKDSPTQLYGETYYDGFPKTPQEAVRLSEGLSEIEKQEWYEWIETATPEQKVELVDILHSMWLQHQAQAQEVETFLGQGEETEGNQQRDEQRVQAYLWLIQELLACPKGEESDVLIRRQYLIDEGFVQVCGEEAARLQREGRENEAQFVRNVAQEIGEYLNRQVSGVSMGEGQANGNETEPEYLNFLMQMLETIVESDSNPSVIYPLLQQNLDKLDLNFAEILQKWAVQIFNEVESNKASVIALVISELANSIQNFPLGNRADNLEIAITAYKIALTGLNRQTLPEEWAQTQMNLGGAYFCRTRGEREENIESAIPHLKAVLEICTRDKYPEKWASNLMILALVYGQRIRGDKAENIEQRIVCYEAALQIYNYERFPKEWAVIHKDLAHAYSNRIQGESSTNIEKAIIGYQAALQVYRYELFPEEWAETQMRLGLVYAHLLQGDKSENLEIAINHFKAALTVYTFSKFPEKWAKVQTVLGVAYSQKIQGKKSENLEKAITCHEKALTVYTRENYSDEWVTLQKNLGDAYNNRIQGDKSANQKRAITYYNSALKIYTRETFPEDWADTQMSLGWAYYALIRGDLAENIERAIAYFEAALQVYVQSTFSYEWADAQGGLGTVYMSRLRGNKAENLEKAIAFCEAALQVHTREKFLNEWSNIQTILGNAYSIRIRGNKAENLEKAITFCEAALQVYTRETYSWAVTQMSLGNAYSIRIRGNKAENLEKAITFCEAALQVYTREGFTYEWATTQVNLGETYRNRIRGERAENLDRAIVCSEAALEIYTRTAFPQEHTKTLGILGLAYQAQSHYYSNDPIKKRTALQNAYTVFEQALDTVEYLRGEITSGDEAKRKLNEEWMGLYVLMVEVCLELGRYTAAIEYVDRSKARNLTELIATRDAYPGGEISAEIRQRLQELRQAISEEDRRLKQDPNPDYTHISQLREEFQAKYPYKPLKFLDIQSLLDDETVILEWYVLNDKFLTFTLTNHSLNLWTSSEEDRQNLIDWTVAYIDDYIDNNSQWRDSLPQRLETLAQILHLDEILANLRQNFPNCQKLILIPHLALHLLPLHALPVATEDGEGKFLQDLFPKGVGYAPNCQVLQQAQNRSRPDFNRLFAIQNPTQDLHFTDMEVEAIQSLFNPHQVLKHDQAEKAALDAETLKNAHCTHFSCHGYFNFEDALKSALILAKSEFTPPPPTDDPSRYLPLEDNKLLDLEKCLTLEDILRLDLTNCRLVTLSACETGITDITSTSDEYIGLPSGFILAGSPNVVSTLWAVADISTAIFMIQFYQTLQNQPELSVVLALRQTQTWLREATVQDLLDWVDGCAVISEERRKQMKRGLAFGNWKKKLDAKRFESPYYWAAFCAIGA